MAAQGKVNEAMAFDGTDSHVSLGTSDASAAAFYRDLTLCAWINTTNASRTEAVFSKFTAAGTASGYIVYVDQNGKANLRVGGEDVTEYPIVVTDSAKINDGQWHHVAVVISLGQNAQFYVDGQISSTSVMHTFAGGDGGSSLNIGVSQWLPYGDYFTGSVDEVQIYGRALGADEVKAVYSLTGGKP
jgi:hypothetical protein